MEYYNTIFFVYNGTAVTQKSFEPWFAHRSPKYPGNIRFKVDLVIE